MTLREAVAKGRACLEGAGSESPNLDAMLLLSFTLGISKERLYSAMSDALPPERESGYYALIDRRASGTPVSYLMREKEFFGRSFYVDERVLAPRPDTETLIEAALALADSDPGVRRVHDLCTGSGCIALTIAAERPRLTVSASDVSPGAGEVFAVNARRIGFDPPFTLCSLFDGLDGPFDLVVSNPPYLTDEEVAQMRLRGLAEPEIALRGGIDGTDFYRTIAGEAKRVLGPRGCLLLEAAPHQIDWLAGYLREQGYGAIATYQDLAGRPRAVLVRHGADVA